MNKPNFLELQANVASFSSSTYSIDFSYAIAIYYANHYKVNGLDGFYAEKFFEESIKPALMSVIEVINEEIRINIDLIVSFARSHYLMRNQIAKGGVFELQVNSIDRDYDEMFTTPARFFEPGVLDDFVSRRRTIKLIHDILVNSFADTNLSAF